MSNASGLIFDLLSSNWTTAPSLFNSSIASAVGFGHPSLSDGPKSLGHLSWGSAIPSPSVSGQPLNLLGPASSGQASLES